MAITLGLTVTNRQSVVHVFDVVPYQIYYPVRLLCFHVELRTIYAAGTSCSVLAGRKWWSLGANACLILNDSIYARTSHPSSRVFLSLGVCFSHPTPQPHNPTTPFTLPSILCYDIHWIRLPSGAQLLGQLLHHLLPGSAITIHTPYSRPPLSCVYCPCLTLLVVEVNTDGKRVEGPHPVVKHMKLWSSAFNVHVLCVPVNWIIGHGGGNLKWTYFTAFASVAFTPDQIKAAPGYNCYSIIPEILRTRSPVSLMIS